MIDENEQPDDLDNDEEGDDLCGEGCQLEDHEITRDEDLPAATGGVAE